jgi:hypothetical protein
MTVISPKSASNIEENFATILNRFSSVPFYPPTNLEIAIALAKRGVKVFPCRGEDQLDANGKALFNKKSPYAKWQEAPTGNVIWVIAMWAKYPTAIPGISLGDQNIIVIDLDTIVGKRQFEALCDYYRSDDLRGPRTYTPDGFHIFYYLGKGVTHGDSLGGLLPKKNGGKIDVRGPGYGYVIAPGAKMVDGEIYVSANSEPLDFLNAPEIPAFLLKELQKSSPCS